MSKIFTIQPTGQTIEVVLPSFEKQIEEYFKSETKTQKQLHTANFIMIENNRFPAFNVDKSTLTDALFLTPLQVVWCSIVIYLKDCGYSDNEIEKTEMLLSAIDEQYNTNLALLEYCLHYCLQNKLPVCLMVTKTGNGKIISCEKMETFYNCDEEDFYINIRLHKILKKALPDFDLSNNLPNNITVSAQEKELLNAIHTNRHLTEVTIKTKNGDIHSAEFCEHVPLNEKKYIQIMNEKSDQTVIIKRQKGKDAFIKRMYQKVFHNN
ncbi:hypothetical protein [Limnovirga soli]|uniref:Uncharacterized protein n=1 Tax=Limnovirga soli TaxID=2656915 RepID=A0A8J8FBK1_9BACT|nr:hypothetical protein [Limnovirga soli]NNV55003.1 hypothetical protein [Limnovirga soli]